MEEEEGEACWAEPVFQTSTNSIGAFLLNPPMLKLKLTAGILPENFVISKSVEAVEGVRLLLGSNNETDDTNVLPTTKKTAASL